jgi:hypothetical protein
MGVFTHPNKLIFEAGQALKEYSEANVRDVQVLTPNENSTIKI